MSELVGLQMIAESFREIAKALQEIALAIREHKQRRHEDRTP